MKERNYEKNYGKKNTVDKDILMHHFAMEIVTVHEFSLF